MTEPPDETKAGPLLVTATSATVIGFTAVACEPVSLALFGSLVYTDDAVTVIGPVAPAMTISEIVFEPGKVMPVITHCPVVGVTIVQLAELVIETMLPPPATLMFTSDVPEGSGPLFVVMIV